MEVSVAGVVDTGAASPYVIAINGKPQAFLELDVTVDGIAPFGVVAVGKEDPSRPPRGLNDTRYLSVINGSVLGWNVSMPMTTGQPPLVLSSIVATTCPDLMSDDVPTDGTCYFGGEGFCGLDTHASMDCIVSSPN